VRQLARYVRRRLTEMGFTLPAGDSPIVPIILGREDAALAAAAKLQERGLLALAIRPPTVKRGSSRLRLTLCCDHTDEEIERLIDCLREDVGA
jgi:8-amino-7-oxononanoate synthase